MTDFVVVVNVAKVTGLVVVVNVVQVTGSVGVVNNVKRRFCGNCQCGESDGFFRCAQRRKNDGFCANCLWSMT